MVKRFGSKECIVGIEFHLYDNPPKFKVNLLYNIENFKIKQELSDAIGLTIGSRSTILTAIWEYIKINNL